MISPTQPSIVEVSNGRDTAASAILDLMEATTGLTNTALYPKQIEPPTAPQEHSSAPDRHPLCELDVHQAFSTFRLIESFMGHPIPDLIPATMQPSEQSPSYQRRQRSRIYRSPNTTPIIRTIPSLSWVNDNNSDYNTLGCRTIPLRKMPGIESCQFLKQLSERTFPQKGVEGGVPRFYVCYTKNSETASSMKEEAVSVEYDKKGTPFLRYRRLYVIRCVLALYAKTIDSSDAAMTETIYRNHSDTSSVVTHPVPRRPLSLHILRHPLSFSIALICRRNEKTNEGDVAVIDEAVAAVTFFFASDQSIVVSLCATSDKTYDNRFGAGNDNESFRRRGILLFLLKSIHIFQANVFRRTSLDNNLRDGAVLFVMLLPTDPSRWLVFRHLGFAFSGYSYKHLETVRGGCDLETATLPFHGHEILYVRYFGKDKMTLYLLITLFSNLFNVYRYRHSSLLQTSTGCNHPKNDKGLEQSTIR
jgi:hypothetical protein